VLAIGTLLGTLLFVVLLPELPLGGGGALPKFTGILN